MVRIEEDPGNGAINEVTKKYMGRDVYSFHQPGDERVVVCARLEHTTQVGV